MKHELFNGKTIDDAINKAIVELRISSDQLEYVVVDKGSTGILGIGSRPAVIEAWAKDSLVHCFAMRIHGNALLEDLG